MCDTKHISQSNIISTLSRCSKMPKINGNEIRMGNILEHNGGLWVAVKIDHVKPGKGGAFAQVEMKNLRNGSKLNTITCRRTINSGSFDAENGVTNRLISRGCKFDPNNFGCSGCCCALFP